jgi:hypothetical protein
VELGVAVLLPPNAALRVQVFLHQAWFFRRLRVPASSLPFSTCHPLLVEEKPLDGPGNYPIDDILIRPPFVFDWIVNAQSRKLGRIVEPVNVLGRFAGAAGIGANRGVDDEHADIGLRQEPAVKNPARKIHDANAIGLANRPKRSFPNADPTGVQYKTELRAFGPQFTILFLNRERAHRA